MSLHFPHLREKEPSQHHRQETRKKAVQPLIDALTVATQTRLLLRPLIRDQNPRRVRVDVLLLPLLPLLPPPGQRWHPPHPEGFAGDREGGVIPISDPIPTAVSATSGTSRMHAFSSTPRPVVSFVNFRSYMPVNPPAHEETPRTCLRFLLQAPLNAVCIQHSAPHGSQVCITQTDTLCIPRPSLSHSHRTKRFVPSPL